jgi:hypothetical protein
MLEPKVNPVCLAPLILHPVWAPVFEYGLTCDGFLANKIWHSWKDFENVIQSSNQMILN